MGRSIVVIGNCQVRPLADALRLIFPGDLIIDISSWDFSNPEYTKDAMSYVNSLDVQVRMPLADSPITPEMIGDNPQQEKVQIPSLVFPAFHPDMVYAVTDQNELFRGVTDYHSAIGLWGWINAIAVDDVERLFEDDVLIALGYDDYWETSVAGLRQAFEASDIEFGRLWANLHRGEVFMHTVNHPNLVGISALAKAVATRLGATADVWNYPLARYITDYCPSAVWPIFPLVGERLGIPGAWHWRLHDRQFLSIREWLEACYQSYDGKDPSSVVCHRFADGTYDQVLRAKLGDLASQVN